MLFKLRTHLNNMRCAITIKTRSDPPYSSVATLVSCAKGKLRQDCETVEKLDGLLEKEIMGMFFSLIRTELCEALDEIECESTNTARLNKIIDELGHVI